MKLLLPKLDLSKTKSWETVLPSPCAISVDLGAAESVWTCGPMGVVGLTDSEADDAVISRAIHHAMGILGPAFAEIARLGQGRTTVQCKSSPTDLVTEMDQGIEMLLRMWINRYLPHHKIVGEEGGQPEIGSEDWVWYLDPIDGTSNYVAGNKNFAIHICCIHNEKVVTSWVGFPAYDMVYHASDFTGIVEKITGGYPLEFTPAASATIPAEVNGVTLMDHLLADLGSKFSECRCIGVYLIHLLEGHHSFFHVRRVNLWDIMAPLAIIKVSGQPYSWGFLLEGLDQSSAISPFSTQLEYLTMLNACHRNQTGGLGPFFLMSRNIVDRLGKDSA